MAAAPRRLTSFLNLIASRHGRPAAAHVQYVWASDNTTDTAIALEPVLGIAPVLNQHASLVPYPALLAVDDTSHVGQQRLEFRNGFSPGLSDADTEAIAARPDAAGVGHFRRPAHRDLHGLQLRRRARDPSAGIPSGDR